MWEYSTAGDNRVRDSHRVLDGKQWPINDPEAVKVYPPNSFNCRCVMVVVDPEDIDPFQMQRSVNVDDAITEGFTGSPNR